MIRTSNRRSFLRQSALTAGGILAGSALLKGRSLFSSAEKLKVGVIGTGDRGTGLINLMNGIGSFDIRAVADPLPFRLEKALKQAPGAKGYENHTQLLEHKDLDAVLIATPFSTHDEVAIAAMEAGLHIYCEKTMVKGIREIQQVLEKAAGTDRIFQTGHQYHSSLLYRKVREIIQYGYIGEITAFHCQWNRNGASRRCSSPFVYRRHPNVGFFFSPFCT
jgi:predicted dehydrogenase